MARSRNIKPDLFKNELLGEADPLLTILFAGLWCLADREGKLLDRPKRIKAEIFPYREIPDFNRYLTVLQQLRFIDRYSVNKVAIIKVLEFKKHQSPHKTEKASELPEKPRETMVTCNAPLDNESLTEEAALIPDSRFLIPDSLTSAAVEGGANFQNFPTEQNTNVCANSLDDHPVWNWQPSQNVFEHLKIHRVPGKFIDEQISQFKTYRAGIQDGFQNFDAKFISSVLGSWKRIGHNWKESPEYNEPEDVFAGWDELATDDEDES